MNTWDIWVFGGGPIVADILSAVSFLLNDGLFKTMFRIMALVGFFVVITGMGLRISPNPAKTLSYIILILFMDIVIFQSTVNVNIEDPISSNEPDIADSPLGFNRIVPNVPLAMAAPAYAVSLMGRGITELIETHFIVDRGFPASGALATGSGKFDFLGQIVRDMGETRITQPELKSSIGNYVADCVVPELYTGQKDIKAIRSSTDLWLELGTNNAGRLTTYFETPSADGVPGDCQAQIDGRIGNIVSCTQAHACIDEDIARYAPLLQKNSSGIDWTNTEAYGFLDRAMSENFVWMAGQDHWGGSGAEMIKRTAVINTFIDGTANVPAGVGGDLLFQVTKAEAKQAQRAQWKIAAEIFNETLGYIFIMIQVLLYGIAPVVLIMILLPGYGAKVGIGYLGLMFWIMLWQPTLAIINFMIASFMKLQARTWNSMDGVYIDNIATMSAYADNMGLAAGFLGTMVPMLTLGLVKGGQMAFTQFTSDTVAPAHANRGAANLAAGNVNLDNKSVSSFSGNKYDDTLSIKGGTDASQMGAGGGSNFTRIGGGGAGQFAGNNAIGDRTDVTAAQNFTTTGGGIKSAGNVVQGGTTDAITTAGGETVARTDQRGTDKALAAAATQSMLDAFATGSRVGSTSTEQTGNGHTASSAANADEQFRLGTDVNLGALTAPLAPKAGAGTPKAGAGPSQTGGGSTSAPVPLSQMPESQIFTPSFGSPLVSGTASNRAMGDVVGLGSAVGAGALALRSQAAAGNAPSTEALTAKIASLLSSPEGRAMNGALENIAPGSTTEQKAQLMAAQMQEAAGSSEVKGEEDGVGFFARNFDAAKNYVRENPGQAIAMAASFVPLTAVPANAFRGFMGASKLVQGLHASGKLGSLGKSVGTFAAGAMGAGLLSGGGGASGTAGSSDSLQSASSVQAAHLEMSSSELVGTRTQSMQQSLQNSLRENVSAANSTISSVQTVGTQAQTGSNIANSTQNDSMATSGAIGGGVSASHGWQAPMGNNRGYMEASTGMLGWGYGRNSRAGESYSDYHQRMTNNSPAVAAHERPGQEMDRASGAVQAGDMVAQNEADKARRAAESEISANRGRANRPINEQLGGAGAQNIDFSGFQNATDLVNGLQGRVDMAQPLSRLDAAAGSAVSNIGVLSDVDRGAAGAITGAFGTNLPTGGMVGYSPAKTEQMLGGSQGGSEGIYSVPGSADSPLPALNAAVSDLGSVSVPVGRANTYPALDSDGNFAVLGNGKTGTPVMNFNGNIGGENVSMNFAYVGGNAVPMQDSRESYNRLINDGANGDGATQDFSAFLRSQQQTVSGNEDALLRSAASGAATNQLRR